MVKAEIAAGKPPLHRAAKRGASAPAVGVAGALASAGVVDSLYEGPCDRDATLLPVFKRETCAEPNQHEPADSIKGALDARPD